MINSASRNTDFFFPLADDSYRYSTIPKKTPPFVPDYRISVKRTAYFSEHYMYTTGVTLQNIVTMLSLFKNLDWEKRLKMNDTLS